MNYQWYPGHMMKAKRMMQEDIRLIDLVIEIIDARVPLSSRNPDIDELGKNKARLIVLNKADLADERQNDAWAAFFQEKGYFTAKVNARSGAGMKKIQETIQEACKEKIERDRRRGIMNRPVRAMVVGIPNAGKSTFINTLSLIHIYTSLIPLKRMYRLELVGGTEASVAVFKNEVQIEAEISYDAAMHTYTITLSDVTPTDTFRVAFGTELQLASNDVKRRIFDLLKCAEIEMDLKMTLNDLINRTDDVTLVAGEIAAMAIDEDLKKALFEILLA